METLPAREHRVHEGTRQVKPASRMVEHPLDEGPHILVREDQAGQLGHTASRDEHARGRVNPYLLHRRIIHQHLEWPKAADVVHEVRFDLRAGRGQQVGGMPINGTLDERAHRRRIASRVNAARSQSLPDTRGERTRHGFHRCASLLQTKPMC